VALAALTLVALSAPVQAGAKGKHKHRAKRQGSGLIASDTAADPNANDFWGRNYCANDSRVQQITTGGDPHPTATGAPQGNSAFRRLTVLDGDDAFGERCELGWDNRHGNTAFYRQGHHRITQISIRLPSGFPLGVYTWQSVMQMKQSGPSANSSGTPVLELDAYSGRWRLRQSLSRKYAEDSRELWSAPAQTNFWTRFAFDIRYSDRKKRGYIRVGVDLNGDGDFADPGELSRGFHTYTLKIETPGGSAADGSPDGIQTGRPIPSHLRAGLYHDSSVPCPPPTGCQVDIDNVQVLRP
jgi:Polysaccharide lyase